MIIQDTTKLYEKNRELIGNQSFLFLTTKSFIIIDSCLLAILFDTTLLIQDSDFLDSISSKVAHFLPFDYI